jgi:hypothetical protein
MDLAAEPANTALAILDRGSASGLPGVRGATVRHDLVTELTRRADWLLGAHREPCLACDRALDAVIASLTARAGYLGFTGGPGPEHVQAAAVVGWIHVPTVALAALSPTGSNPGQALVTSE